MAVLALAAFLPSPAAAEPTEPIRISFQAPAGCPDVDAFTAEIMARTARARLAAPGETARAFTVTLTTGRRGARGTLSIDDGAGREITGGTCAEIVSALALVSALAIDPKASTAAKARLAPRAPPPPAREIGPPPPPYAPLPWWGPIGAPLPVFASVTAPASRWRLAIALHVSGASAVAPRLVPVASGSVEIALVGAGVLAPAFRISWLEASSGVTAIAGAPAQARFRWAAARVEGCPARLELNLARLTALPCALFDAGAIAADGSSPAPVPSQLRRWLAPGLLGRVQIELLDGLLVEGEGGATFPLDHYQFAFTRGTGTIPVHTVPAAGGFFGGGAGMHFP